ncbi:MAG: RNA methyltransferase [Acidobacteriota bacterium]|jgi:TrmH family RNA methyltransferase
MKLSKTRAGLLQRLQQRKQREREGCFLVEGLRSVRAVLEADLPVRFAVMSPRLAELDADGTLAEMLSHARFDVIAIDDKELSELAGTVSPQGILMVCEEPRVALADLAPRSGGVLVADAVQDPSNLGAMIRSGAAFGLTGLVALNGTVDAWNAKVVRGSAGASFRLPVVQATCAELLEWASSMGIRLLAADTSGEDVAGVNRSLPWALIIGNEGAGLRDELRAAAAATVTVPIRVEADSLNAGVAAAILCYELTRATVR